VAANHSIPACATQLHWVQADRSRISLNWPAPSDARALIDLDIVSASVSGYGTFYRTSAEGLWRSSGDYDFPASGNGAVKLAHQARRADVYGGCCAL